MGKAWMDKNISPYEFRKCLTSDLQFVNKFEKAINKKMQEKREQAEHEQHVIQAMRNL